jgi:hypothetical protein
MSSEDNGWEVPGTPHVIVTSSINQLRKGGGGSAAIRHARLTSASHQFHDRCPDIRRQVAPGRDKLAEDGDLPTQFRQAQGV